MERYLSANSSIVKCKHFECAIVKLQNKNNYQPLTEQESAAVAHFLIQPATNTDSSTVSTTALTTVMSPCERLKLKRQRTSIHPSYRSVAHVLPTSNIVERLFSESKYVMTDSRKHMNPEHLNEIMVLRYHKAHWNPHLVQSCMRMSEETKNNNEN